MEQGHTKGDGTRDAQPLPRSTDENETGCTSCGSAPLPLTVDGTSWCKSRSTKIHTEKPFAQLQSGTNRSFTYNPGIKRLASTHNGRNRDWLPIIVIPSNKLNGISEDSKSATLCTVTLYDLKTALS